MAKSGTKPSTKKTKTIYDIAKIAGVSPATVSLVLNDKGNITEETRRRIKDIAKKNNYSPNLIARGLRKSKTNSLGVVIDHFHNSFFNSVFDGIESITDPLGYSFLVAESREDYEKEKQEISLLLRHGVDGLILFPCSQKYSYVQNMQKLNNIPVVLIGNFFRVHQFPEVVADNYNGARIATEKLISLNRYPILHIAGPQEQSMCRLRKTAFEDTMKKKMSKADIAKHIFIADDLSVVEGYNTAAKIAEKFSPPYSIFVVNDTTALGVMKFCKKNKLKIPRDVSLIGFSDIELLDELDIGLSSVRIPGKEMGRLAANYLLSCTKLKPIKCEYQRIELPVQLIERQSTVLKNFIKK